jgi:hypothetical protein
MGADRFVAPVAIYQWLLRHNGSPGHCQLDTSAAKRRSHGGLDRCLVGANGRAIFIAATVGFDIASNLLVTKVKAYLANPTAGVLAQIQNQVVTFQQQVNASLLQTAKIVDLASQKHALSAVQAVATVVTAMLALVQSVSTKAAVAQMACQSTIKVATVEPFLDRGQSAQIVASHYGEPLAAAGVQVTQATRSQREMGF